MDMSQYLEIFIEEAKEHLQSLNQSLLQLEKNPGDSAMVNEIFRVAHTLKGMSATMGFTKMARLTHDMEDVLHLIRNSEIKISTTLVDVLFSCLDALDNYLSGIIDSGSEGDREYYELIEALGGIARNGVAPAPAEAVEFKPEEELKTSGFVVNQYEQNVLNKACEMGMNAFKITVVLNKGCVLKSARAFIIFQALERHSEIIKSEPKVEDIEDEKFDNEFTVAIVTKEAEEVFSDELNSIAEVEKVVITRLESTADTDGAPVRKQEQATGSLEEVVAGTEEAAADFEEEALHKTESASARKQKTGKTVRVDIDRLDVLLNLVSELIIQKTRLEGLEIADKSQTFTETVEYLERITTNLHDAVMKVRMVPVETVFNRFPRMIRDITKELGKEVVLEMSGEETELDRTVIDEIGDPLIHLLRNSVDHGIEASVEERRKLGKPGAGQISLRAYQDGTNVVIEVQDDGRGIDLDRTKKKAVERGLISKELVNNLSKKDIIDFLFRPSFSTADKITDISGRGVGLDVVKTKIETLGGMVEVETELGAGSRFIIRLPLTLAIIQALLVRVGEEKYALQLSSIKQIINIAPDDIKLVQKQEVILLRNMVIPIVRLDKVLEVPGSVEEQQRKQYTCVIVKKGDRLSGFLVDSIIGQQEIVQKSLGKFFAGNKIITSATILGDGNVALILDVNTLA